MGGNCWSRGPESQEAPAIWLGGVSAVISASDLDDHSFGLGDCKAMYINCIDSVVVKNKSQSGVHIVRRCLFMSF